MDIDRLRRRAEVFRSLHIGTTPLVLINVWDVVSARLIERAGFPAIATTSAGVAWSLGYPDGERITRREMLDVVTRISRAVSVPVTADLESGYAQTPGEVADTVYAALEAGAVGMNLEDSRSDASPGQDPLLPVGAAADRVAAASAAAAASGIAFTINARTDVYLAEVGPPETRFARAVERANAYRAAGADCLFVPAVRDAATIARLVAAIDGPINVLAGPGTPSIGELGLMGVARISFGSSSMRAALSAFARAAAAVRDTGDVEPIVGSALAFADIETLMQQR